MFEGKGFLYQIKGDLFSRNHEHVLLKASWFKHNTEEMTLGMMRNKAKSLNIAVIMKRKVMGSEAVIKRNIMVANTAMSMRVMKHKTVKGKSMTVMKKAVTKTKKETLKQAMIRERKYKTWIMKGILQSIC